MATKHISGINTEKVEINSSGNTWILDKNAHISSTDYGILLNPTANNSVVDIQGSISASVGVQGTADKLKVMVGSSADVTAQVGILMVGADQFTAKIDGDIFGLQYGVFSVASKTQIDVGKGGSVESGVIAINAMGTGNLTAKIDGEVEGGQAGIVAVAQKAKVTVGKDGSVEGGVYGVISQGTNSFTAKVDGDIYGGQYGLVTAAEKAEVTLGKGGSTTGGVYGINATGTTRFDATINDDVFGGQFGIMSAAEKGKISIGNGAAVEGGAFGIFMAGSADASVINRGSIAATAGFGINLGAGGDVRNFGDMQGVGGINVSGDSVKIINEDGASILTMSYGMIGQSTSGHSAKITNHGLVVTSDPAGYGIVGGNGDDTIINDGRVYGIIAAGGGADKIDLRGGMVKGDIQGGDGDDTLITDKASHKLIESAAQGTDTVKSSVNYTLQSEVEKLFLTGDKDIDGKGGDTANELHGNKGDNVLRGMAGMDELFGGKGVDRLFGGDDADIFHFSTGDGKDTIADLATTVDDVDLSGWTAVQDFNEVLDHAKNDGDGNVVIKAGNDSLTILGMEKGDLDMNDFTF